MLSTAVVATPCISQLGKWMTKNRLRCRDDRPIDFMAHTLSLSVDTHRKGRIHWNRLLQHTVAANCNFCIWHETHVFLNSENKTKNKQSLFGAAQQRCNACYLRIRCAPTKSLYRAHGERSISHNCSWTFCSSLPFDTQMQMAINLYKQLMQWGNSSADDRPAERMWWTNVSATSKQDVNAYLKTIWDNK